MTIELNSSANQAAIAYIALGSNIGNREELLREALRLLQEHPSVEVLKVSGLYETDPVGYTDQPAFLNMAACLQTTLDPLSLLRTMLNIEQQLGREREIRFGPRTIDLDLLLYEDAQIDEVELILPHPRMMERAFVLVPLSEVLQAGHPLGHQARQAASTALQDGGEGITLWTTINWPTESAPLGS